MEKLYLMFPEELGEIAPEVYGHFSEHIGGVIYDGIWVGKDSEVENVHGFRKFLIDKFAAIHPPVLRWPGGCFAETYDWRDGIGKGRPVRPNWWTRNDNRYESNEVGTHEFMEFCELVGTKPYLAANLTSVTPLHVRDWIDYCNSPEGTTSYAKERAENGHPAPFDVKYWGIGNENWGGGGNMTPEYYAMEYRRFSALADNLPGDKILIACGPNGADYGWTKGFMESMADSEKHMQGFSLHYYCAFAGDPVAFSRDEWYQQLQQALWMEDILKRHWSIIEGYGMQVWSKLVIDEWGCWHPNGSGPSRGFNLFEQQSTMRDAMVTALTLNIFNNHCDKIMMANVAQLVNNLHALFLAGGKDCIVTPTYHVFDMYKGHQGATAIRTAVKQQKVAFTDKQGREAGIDNLSVSASCKCGSVTITIANLSAEEDSRLLLTPVGRQFCDVAKMQVLAEEDYHAHNTFEEPERVLPKTQTVDLREEIVIPRAGIVSIEAKIRE